MNVNKKTIGVFQFTHPGEEHSKGLSLLGTDYFFKKWNYSHKHKRKYIRNNVTFIDQQNNIRHGLADFWGEWEPNSLARTLVNKPNDNQSPSFLHYPVFIKNDSIDLNSNNNISKKIISAKQAEYANKQNLQNTDPFVFGDCFYYTCCKQDQTKNLDRGSVILFGSTFKNPAKFVIDTVFVIDKIIDCDEVKSKEYSGIFYDAVLDKIYHGHTNGPRLKSNKIIMGATFDNPVNGMYSFFPCHEADNKNTYQRLGISSSLHENISSTLQSMGKYITTTAEDTFNFWASLKDYTLAEGYHLGVKAELPPVLTPEEIPEYIKNLK